MIYEHEAELKDRVESLIWRRLRECPRVVVDTSDYLAVAAGTVLRVDGNDYYILTEATEGRFGISEQPKYWVKHAIDLTTGARKVIKLVFHEQFTTRVGLFKVHCRRSPDKESAVLEAVEGDPAFMQGVTVRDPAGNNIRIIDLIRGKTLFNHIAELQLSHEAYTVQALPDILARLVGCTEAMASLHDRGLTHGDIRNDHILVESDTGRYRWIDFDYTINYSDFDIWSMGNVLTYAVSKGIITCRSAIRAGVELSEDDALLFYGYRVANVRKVHPHVPRELNDLLMRFSHGSTDFVSSFDELAEGLRVAAAALRPAS